MVCVLERNGLLITFWHSFHCVENLLKLSAMVCCHHLSYWQDELVSLCRQHYYDELQLQLCHESSLCVMLERLASNHRDHMMTSLDNIHHRQVQQLKRQMDVGNKDEMKMLANTYTDKQELARYSLPPAFYLQAFFFLVFREYLSVTFNWFCWQSARDRHSRILSNFHAHSNYCLLLWQSEEQVVKELSRKLTSWGIYIMGENFLWYLTMSAASKSECCSIACGKIPVSLITVTTAQRHVGKFA